MVFLTDSCLIQMPDDAFEWQISFNKYEIIKTYLKIFQRQSGEAEGTKHKPQS
jgi:hypothetical protein